MRAGVAASRYSSVRAELLHLAALSSLEDCPLPQLKIAHHHVHIPVNGKEERGRKGILLSSYRQSSKIQTYASQLLTPCHRVKNRMHHRKAVKWKLELESKAANKYVHYFGERNSKKTSYFLVLFSFMIFIPVTLFSQIIFQFTNSLV